MTSRILVHSCPLRQRMAEAVANSGLQVPHPWSNKFSSFIRRPYVSNIAVLLWCHHEHKYISQHKILNTDIRVKTQSK